MLIRNRMSPGHYISNVCQINEHPQESPPRQQTRSKTTPGHKTKTSTNAKPSRIEQHQYQVGKCQEESGTAKLNEHPKSSTPNHQLWDQTKPTLLSMCTRSMFWDNMWLGMWPCFSLTCQDCSVGITECLLVLMCVMLAQYGNKASQ